MHKEMKQYKLLIIHMSYICLIVCISLCTDLIFATVCPSRTNIVAKKKAFSIMLHGVKLENIYKQQE